MQKSFGQVNIRRMSKFCGRSPSFMGRVMSGEKRPSLYTLHMMAEYLGMTMDEVYDGLKKNREASRVFLW